MHGTALYFCSVNIRIRKKTCSPCVNSSLQLHCVRTPEPSVTPLRKLLFLFFSLQPSYEEMTSFPFLSWVQNYLKIKPVELASWINYVPDKNKPEIWNGMPMHSALMRSVIASPAHDTSLFYVKPRILLPFNRSVCLAWLIQATALQLILCT